MKWAKVKPDGSIEALYLVEPSEAEIAQFIEAPDEVFADWWYFDGSWFPPTHFAEVSVPMEVTPRQLRLALHEMGMLNQVESFLALSDEATKIEWEYATVMRRDHQMWIVGAQFLGKTSEDIDDLFMLAGAK